ncbi:SH3 domain-containing protein 3 [Linum grandiflorum]
MDALRKQASKLREKVSNKQQAVRKQLSGSRYESSDSVVEEVELQRHQQLEKLYRTTRAGRQEFQKDIAGAAEALTANGYKHNEAETKLYEDCCRYGTENNSDTMLAKAVAIYGDACKNVEKETEDLNRLLSLQAAELSKRQARVRESPVPENVAKWQAAEAKMQELKANMAVLGKEASAALAAVEAQQQRLTFQRLVSLVEGEKNYHLRIGAILSEVETEVSQLVDGSDKQQRDSAPPVIPTSVTPSQTGSEKTTYFLAEATHPFHAETDKELSLAIGDFVVVRKVTCISWKKWTPASYFRPVHGMELLCDDPNYSPKDGEFFCRFSSSYAGRVVGRRMQREIRMVPVGIR